MVQSLINVCEVPHFATGRSVHFKPQYEKELNSMKNKLMLGLWRYMLNIPASLWEKKRAGKKKLILANLAFVTTEHRLIHHFVVRELPFAGKPLPPEYVANALNLPTERVIAILDDLEAHMTFLFRNAQGEIVWAYPVTVEKTPHKVTFHTGEQLYAA
jgi:hypothetical protein